MNSKASFLRSNIQFDQGTKKKQKSFYLFQDLELMRSNLQLLTEDNTPYQNLRDQEPAE